jgi:hypothetical protein
MPPESKKTYSKSTLIETVLYRRPKRKKLMWMARFGAEIAKHNALMISRSQNIADCE